MKHVYELNSRRLHPDEIWRRVENSVGTEWLPGDTGSTPLSYVHRSDILIGVFWMGRGRWELRYAFQTIGMVDVWRIQAKGAVDTPVRRIDVIEKYSLDIREAV